MASDVAHRLPRFLGNGGRLFRRSPFLSGDQRTYFGPGQGPEILSGYAPPDDWPEAGRLLRVPQVVWLSCMIPPRVQEGFTITGSGPESFEFTSYLLGPDPFIGTRLEDVVGAAWLQQFGADDPQLGVPQWRYTEYAMTGESSLGPIRDDGAHYLGLNYYNNDPISWTLDRARLKEAFDAVKEAIEAIRPGATFVEVQGWDDPVPADSLAGGTYPHMVAPPEGEEFFGTNFLHVYVGPVVQNTTDPSAELTPRRDFYLYEYRPSDYEAAAARLVSAHPKFAGYAAWLYGMDGELTGNENPDVSYDTPTTVPLFREGGGDAGFPGGDHTRTIASEPANAFLAAEALALADYGFEYRGTAASLDVAGLVEAIAAHFGFDPDSGQDLPVG